MSSEEEKDTLQGNNKDVVQNETPNMQNSENENQDQLQDQEVTQEKKEMDPADEIMQMYNERKAAEEKAKKEAEETEKAQPQDEDVKPEIIEKEEMENVIEKESEEIAVEAVVEVEKEEVEVKTEAEIEEAAKKDEQEETKPVEESNSEDFFKSLEEKDLTTLPQSELLNISNELLKASDMKKADGFFKSIKEAMDQLFEVEKEKAKAEYVANAGNEEGFQFKASQDIIAFNANFKSFRENKKHLYEAQVKERESNLKVKKDLIEELKSLMDSVGEKGNLEAVKQVQQKWKETGNIPQQNVENINQTFKALLDRFYDKRQLEFELRELDRNKNLKSKLDLCDKAEKLIEEENINEANRKLNQLHETYKKIGPVPKEDQEKIWERFKAASDKFYEKRRVYVEAFKEELKDNMKKKQQLCLDIEPFTSFTSDKIRDWNDKTKEILALQTEWEKIGALPKEVAKDINKQFWGNLKSFFNNKNHFFDDLGKARGENLKKKEVLCEQAEALQESTDWIATADQLKNLQQEWKDIGPVPEAQRESIYQRFKAACDTFFNKKREQKGLKDKEFKVNLKKKKEVCKAIEDLAQDENANMEAFHELKNQYFEIGFVPRQSMNEIMEQFLLSIDKFFENVSIEGVSEDDLSKLEHEIHLEILEKVPNASRRLQRKEQNIRKKISNLENDIALWANNLQFFATSKTADKLRDEFNIKIETANKKLKVLKEQLHSIRKVAQ